MKIFIDLYLNLCHKEITISLLNITFNTSLEKLFLCKHEDLATMCHSNLANSATYIDYF